MIDYIVCDVETTGLDTETDQVVQIAMYHRKSARSMLAYIYHNELRFRSLWSIKNLDWTGFLEKLNDNIVEKDRMHLVSARPLLEWVAGCECKTFAGKNFGSFDRRFLINWDRRFAELIGHRSLDPALLYATPADQEIPTLSECAKRAGLVFELHNPMSEVLLVHQLLEKKL